MGWTHTDSDGFTTIRDGARDEVEVERLIDARVQRRLATDSAYRNAENAEEQSAREDEITRQECERAGVPTS